jgi:DUF4097 and DUF4098 domain-containing protein YvlB
MEQSGETPKPPERHVSTLTKIIGTFLGIFGALLLVGIILFSIFGITSIVAATQPPVSAHSLQTLSVSGTPTLTLTGAAADAQFVTGTSNQVSVAVYKTVRALSHDQAQQVLDAIKVDVTQNGNAITINEIIPNDGGRNFWWFHAGTRSVALVVTVPANANLAVTTSAGNISVNDVTGQMTFAATAGNLHFQHVTLTGVSHVKASAGDVIISGALADQASLTIDSSAGNFSFTGTLGANDAITIRDAAGNVTVQLPASTAAHVDARVSAGDIDIAGVPLTVDRQIAEASLFGDTAPNPTNTLSVQMSAGNFTFIMR